MIGSVDNADALALQRITGRTRNIVQISREDVRRCCRSARLSPLHEQLNSHYAHRPVVVILSHTSSTGPAMRQEWDPLYTGLGLGTNRNVTIVANLQGLEAA